ncbi:hypothetical protein [Nonomuraea roseola]|uniref:Uncharacterized protein n=1 Tax=Nonomuraea roseola TaxID=46179 RepID=A0ABV5Q7N2_9ACTN
MSTGRVRTLPFCLALAGPARHPVKALEQAGSEAGGAQVKLSLGPSRPFLAAYPVHVRHVLGTSQANHLREGTFCDPMIPLSGDGILAAGQAWGDSGKAPRRLFTAKRLRDASSRTALHLERQIGFAIGFHGIADTWREL